MSKKALPTLVWQKGLKVGRNVTLVNEGRVVLETAWLRPIKDDEAGRWWLQATNAYTFVGVAMLVENDQVLRERAEACGAIPIPPKALQALEQGASFPAAIFEEDGSVTVDDVTYHPPREWPDGIREDGYPELPGKFPEMERLEPDLKKGKVYEIGVDVDLLLKLARAMGSKQVRLRFDTDSNLRPFYVEPLTGSRAGSEDTKGFQMPIRLNV